MVPTWRATGSKKAPDSQNYNNWPDQWEMVYPPRPQLQDFQDICKLGVVADSPTESCVFWISFLRFCGDVAERGWEYSMLLIVSTAHHTFLDEVGFDMIVNTFRVSVGEAFVSFGVFLGTLFEVLSLSTYEVNRHTTGESGCGGAGSLKQLPP